MKRCLAILLCLGCGGLPALDVDMPLHLEEHLDAAVITGSEQPPNAPPSVEWRFDQPQPGWRVTPQWNPPFGAPTIARTSNGLLVTLTDRTRFGVADGRLRGVIHVVVPDWDRRDWSEVVVRARADSTSSVNRLGLGFNLRAGRGTGASLQAPFEVLGQQSPIVRDGTVHTYRLRVGQGARSFQRPWRELALFFASDSDPGSIEIFSVSVVPTAASFADSSRGVRMVTVGERTRRGLYVHAPASLSYRIRVPEGGRLDAGLGVLASRDSVTFRVSASDGGVEETLFEERYVDPTQWGQRSIDLARFAGRAVTLTLQVDAGLPGAVALWGAPTISGRRTSTKPNVIFYVIDGGGADQMSVYGYNRRTTPNLERLAAEGAVFLDAHSNASWTKPSTASFMTSLHSSVLGLTEDRTPVPEQALTMSQRFHSDGYQTAILTSNSNAGSVSGLERGADVFRDHGVTRPDTGGQSRRIGNASSSIQLHRDFWDWRESSPGEPYWVHFQTTDVHTDLMPPAPFAGLFVTPGAPGILDRWDSTLDHWQRRNAARIRAEPHFERKQFAETGIGRQQYFDLVRSLYDESMAHQDYQLGRFVQRLKETGQWENTLLVIAADHGISAAGEDFLVPLSDSLPPEWRMWGNTGGGPIFRSSVSHVPLMFIWPGHIEGGQRFSQTVSMIDVLPTVLDLAGLPPAEVLQGQSLAPLLQGRSGWQLRPVIFDEFAKDGRTGALRGRIEMIDGRWGASLWIGPPADTMNHRSTPLLLFDVENDPLALRPMNDEHPELVKKYTLLLQKQWEAHRLLAKRFTAGGKVELTPEQLETLRALGYIR